MYVSYFPFLIFFHAEFVNKKTYTRFARINFRRAFFLQFIIRPRHPQLQTRQDQLPYKSFRPHFIFLTLFMPYFYIAFSRVAISPALRLMRAVRNAQHLRDWVSNSTR